MLRDGFGKTNMQPPVPFSSARSGCIAKNMRLQVGMNSVVHNPSPRLSPARAAPPGILGPWPRQETHTTHYTPTKKAPPADTLISCSGYLPVNKIHRACYPTARPLFAWGGAPAPKSCQCAGRWARGGAGGNVRAGSPPYSSRPGNPPPPRARPHLPGRMVSYIWPPGAHAQASARDARGAANEGRGPRGQANPRPPLL
jgi:hypothetical protein